MATIKDVAALSGVSVTTVSRVLNRHIFVLTVDTFFNIYYYISNI